ncbi:hypothetical protein FGRMN_10294 [Fusarium graminum]|nr:hypothetical protein FGRMN_10294 [Fusarium graminum]
MANLADSYKKYMKRHPYGLALFEPAPFTRLQPGTLGYLDEYQRWHPIMNLLDDEALRKAGYPPLGELKPKEPDVRRFGPMLSENMGKTTLDLEAGVGAAVTGIPVDVSGAVKYSTTNEFGAVLVCENDVVSEGFDLRQPFNTWMEANVKALLKTYPDAKKNGLYAVTETYSSTDIHISAWDAKSNDSTVMFKVGMAGAGNIGPKASWVRGESSSGWTEWNDQKRVLFFTGVHMVTSLFGRAKRVKSGLSDDVKKFWVDGDEEDGKFKVFLEPVGDTNKAKAESTDESLFG